MARKIAYYRVSFVSGDGSAATTEFTDRDRAWNFMRLCDSLGVWCGFPQAVFQ